MPDSYNNDPLDFWEDALEESGSLWQSALPGATTTIGRHSLSREVRNLINYMSVDVEFNGHILKAFLDQAGNTGFILQTGGSVLGGIITLYFNSDDFDGDAPKASSAIKLRMRKSMEWKEFYVTGVGGDFRDGDAGLIITAEPMENMR